MFENLNRQFETVNFPSLGAFYKNKDPFVYVQLLTYMEELLLINPSFTTDICILTEVLKRLVISDFDVSTLLSCDVFALSSTVYAYSFGDKHTIEVECTHCHKTDKEYSFNISDFQAKDFDVSLINENGEILVPKNQCGHDILIKPRTFIEDFNYKQQNTKNKETAQVAYNIVSFDGETDVEVISKKLSSMRIVHFRTLKAAIQNSMPGVESWTNFECPSCGNTTRMDFGTNIFFLKMQESHITNMREEIFLLNRHGKTVTIEDAKKLTISERRWYIDRIRKANEEQSKAEEAAMSKAKSRKGK